MRIRDLRKAIWFYSPSEVVLVTWMLPLPRLLPPSARGWHRHPTKHSRNPTETPRPVFRSDSFPVRKQVALTPLGPGVCLPHTHAEVLVTWSHPLRRLLPGLNGIRVYTELDCCLNIIRSSPPGIGVPLLPIPPRVIVFMACLLISEHDHFTPTRKIKQRVRALAHNHPAGWKMQGHVCHQGGSNHLLQFP